MTSKEALKIIGDINLGNNPYCNFEEDKLKNCMDEEYNIIKEDLVRLEKLEKTIEILKDTKNIEIYFFDNGKRHYRIKFDRTREQEISKQKYNLLKEVLENANKKED